MTDHDLAFLFAIMADVFGLRKAPALRIELCRIELAQGKAELVTRLIVQAPLVAFDA